MKKIAQRKWLLIGIDLLVLVLSCLVSWWLVNNSSLPSLNQRDVLINGTVFVVCTMIASFLLGTYNKIWRFANARDLLCCVIGVIFGSMASFSILFLSELLVSTLYFCLCALMSLCAVLGARLLYLYLLYVMDMHLYATVKKRTMIVGAGMACQSILNEMFRIPSCEFLPVCIVDDDTEKISRSLNGVKILGPTDNIPQICKKYNVESIIFAIPSCPEKARKRILTLCSETNCKVKVLPYIHRLIFNKNLLAQTTDVHIEDLLGRDPIRFDNTQLSMLVRDKVCLVTGGGGSIGSELCRQLAKYNPQKLVILDIYENNAYEIQQELYRKYGDKLSFDVQIASVRDYKKMERLFREYKPNLVFHAAAHKHVPLMETNPEEAVKNNVFGTLNVAQLSKETGVEKFVLISTDKAVNPTNIMGATKRCCEMIVQHMAQQGSKTEFVAVRFGNVLGSNGSVIPLFRKQIEDGGPITVTHPDIIRYFMTIPEAVSLVLQAGAMASGGEVFVLDMGEPVKITTLAENLIRLYGKEPNVDIKIEFTGLRPGEKLFEELLMDEEGLRSTMNHKIFIGNQIDVDANDFCKKMEQLKFVAENGTALEVLTCVHELVPSFQHQKLIENKITMRVTK